MAGLLVLGLGMAFQRAIDHGPDLAGFCDAGRYIIEHGTRDPGSTLSRYWPSADVPWIALCLLPIPFTAVLWFLLNTAAWFGLLRFVCRSLLPAPCSPLCRHATLAAGLLAMPLVIDGMALGSFHVLMLWLMLLGLDRACRGRPTSGGVLLGVAAWLKLLPLLGVGFLLYHRKWKAAATALATVAALDIVLSLAAFGPAGAWREHAVWWREGAQGTADRQLTSVGPVDEDRLTNQSVAITLRRLLTSMGTGKLPGMEPAAALTPDGRTRQHVQLADLAPGQLHGAYLAAMALLAVAVAIYCRPGGASLPEKLAMLSLATLWFSPVTWSYHFVACLPALAILLLRARYRAAWVLPILAVWCGALALLAFDTMRVAGVLLWMSLLVGAGLVVYPAYSLRGGK